MRAEVGRQKKKERNKELKNGRKTGESAAIELPEILNSPEFRSALESWIAYRGVSYKPRGLSSLLSQAAKRAEAHGIEAVIEAMEVAASNGWTGWNQDSSFEKPRDFRDPTGNLAMAQKLISEGEFDE